MPLDFVNILPENNLRLPDALTIKHGPARLLSRFILEGDKAARCNGIEVRLRHDFDELLFLNKHQTALGNWYPLVDMVHPDRTELTPENAFWVSAENRTGEIVATWGARVFDWSFCYVTRGQVEKGLAASYGQRNLSYSIEYSGSALGELVLAYTSIDEVYEDFARFMLAELVGIEAGESHSNSVETSLEHNVTNISSEGVFQGSISLS